MILIIIIVGIIIIVLLLYRYFYNSWYVGEFFPDHQPKLKVFYKNFLCLLILYYNSSLRLLFSVSRWSTAVHEADSHLDLHVFWGKLIHHESMFPQIGATTLIIILFVSTSFLWSFSFQALIIAGSIRFAKIPLDHTKSGPAGFKLH